MTDIIPPDHDEPYEEHSAPLLEHRNPPPPRLQPPPSIPPPPAIDYSVVLPGLLTELKKRMPDMSWGERNAIKLALPIILKIIPGSDPYKPLVADYLNSDDDKPYGEENDIEDDEYEVDEHQRPRRAAPGASILKLAVNDAIELLDNGLAPKSVCEHINDLYDLNWTYQDVARIAVRRTYAPRNSTDGAGRKNDPQLSKKYLDTLNDLKSQNKQLLEEKKKSDEKVGLIRWVGRKLW